MSKDLRAQHTAPVCVMGILNTTPDSFSDGGCFVETDQALQQARQMIADGAAFIDVGGESTRPGAAQISIQQELDRVIPIITAIKQHSDITISIDSSKAVVMREAVAAGAGMINDVYALRQEGALQAAVDCKVPVCLMHMLGAPCDMQQNPLYDDVINDIKTFLQRRVTACIEAGIPQDALIIDPGFGFGKTAAQNLNLIKRLNEFKTLNTPLLIGVSRKSTIGIVLDAPVEKRLHGSLALAVLAANNGANIIRSHDVKATVDAIRMVNAVNKEQDE